ncbi:MAG: hypothetical protein HZB82_00230 [Deltaproteobacteria bacterium]|nr:hypothetical protein [Deltaproteobacteria bacterium]
MTILKKILPFGEIMVSLGVITKEQLDIALKEGKKTNTRVGKVLVNLGFAAENDIANALAVQYQIPAVILSSTILDPAVVKLIPESVARRYLVIPIAVDGDVLQVAMIDPLNVFAIDEIKRATRYKIKTIVTTETEITNAINQYYP